MDGCRRALLQHPSLVQHHQAVGQQAGLVQIVRHQHDGDGEFTAQIGEQPVQALAGHLVHGGERLVQQQQAGLAGQGTGHRHTLLLATRQGGRAALLLRGVQTHVVQPAPRLRLPLHLGQVQQRQGHVVAGIQMGHQRVVLEDQAHVALLRCQPLARGGVHPDLTVHAHPALARPQQAGHETQQRGLARARGPHQSQQLAGRTAKRARQRHGRDLLHLHLQGQARRRGLHAHRRTVSRAEAKNEAATATSEATASSSAMRSAPARSKACTRS